MSRLSWPLAFRVAILSVVLGTAAGVIGAAFTTAYLSDYAASLGQLSSPLRLVGSRTVVPSAALTETRDLAFSASVQLYIGKSESPDPLRADRQGVVLTSDGWLAALDGGKTYATAVVGRRSYPVVRTVSDPISGAVFLKVDAQNLPTVGFGDAFVLGSGDDLFALDGREALRHARVIGVTRPIAYGTDRLVRHIATDLSPASAAAPVFSNAGDLLGFTTADGSLLSMNSLLPSFRLLVKGEKMARPVLGLTGVDLARVVVGTTSPSPASDAGFRVSTVGRGSVSETAGIRAGDVILSLDGRSIDAAHPLDEMLLDYAIGQTPSFSLLRGTTSMTLSIPLR